MMRAKALVLTFDKNRVCTENMILQYEELLGPDAFHFIVPFQKDQSLSSRIQSDVKLVQSDAPIPATVATLLGAVDPDEMVYWCIDDKYPVALDTSAMRSAASMLQRTPEIDGLCLAVSRQLAWGMGLGIRKQALDGFTGFLRTNFNQFWLHQFMRAKVIAHVFDHFSSQIGAAKEMDDQLDAITRNPFRMYVTESNHITFGESASRGKLTPNFVRLAQSNGLEVDPERPVTQEEIYIGEMGETVRFSRRKRWFRI